MGTGEVDDKSLCYSEGSIIEIYCFENISQIFKNHNLHWVTMSAR